MAWETSVDRLLLQQIHLAEKAEVKPDAVRALLTDLWQMAGPRTGTSYLLGYARVLLGLELPDVGQDPRLRRWHLFGRIRGHDRRGERNWIAENLLDPQVLLDLLAEPELAGQALPVVVRTLFWCGDLKLAVRAIHYLASQSGSDELDIIVDAAVTDLLARLENRVDREDQETTASILTKVLQLDSFARLPVDVRARYHKALAERLLAGSEWHEALQHLHTAAELAREHQKLRSAIFGLAALAELRVHTLEQLEPRTERPDRDKALALLRHIEEDPDAAAPDALFVRSLLAYETGDYAVAARGMELAIAGCRRHDGRDEVRINRARFFAAASLLAANLPEEAPRALQWMEKALETVKPDLESFYHVHEALKKLDRRLALRFLDAVDVGRGSSPDQLLFIALEYQSLAEAEPALRAARRVLEVAANLDQRIEALQVMLVAHNMLGAREQARGSYAEMRELLLHRGAFEQLERLLKNEELVGQALDHVEIKCELAAIYEEMEGHDYDRAQLQMGIARSLRARKDVEALRQAHGLLEEVACVYPELAKDDMAAIEKLLEMNDAQPASDDSGRSACAAAQKQLGHKPRVLVVGGNERQRRHHPRFEKLAAEWGFVGEWHMANYVSPQRAVSHIADRVKSGLDILVLLHWNRHETTEPAHELARKAGLPARTVHYAGFTSLQVALAEMIERLGQPKTAKAGKD